MQRKHFLIVSAIIASISGCAASSFHPPINVTRIPGKGSTFLFTTYLDDSVAGGQYDSVVSSVHDALGREKTVSIKTISWPQYSQTMAPRAKLTPALTRHSYASAPALEVLSPAAPIWIYLPFDGSANRTVTVRDTLLEGATWKQWVRVSYLGDSMVTIVGKPMRCLRVKYEYTEERGAKSWSDTRVIHFAPEIGYKVLTVSERDGKQQKWLLTEYTVR
jgi:hypothetical protein